MLMKKNLTHFNKSGDAYMVDIHNKNNTNRIAIASGKIYMSVNSIKNIRCIRSFSASANISLMPSP